MQREFVFTDAPFASCHASTVAVLREGDVVAAWFGGSREGASDVAIWCSRRTGDRWTDATVAADVPDQVACWNPVLHAGADGELLLFFKAGTSPMTWSGLVCRSGDRGASWSAPELLPAGILGPVKNKPFELADGTLVCGSSVESYRSWACWVDRTPHGGRTWTKHGPIGREAIQPAIYGTPDGTLAMLCRTRGLGRLVRATSTDGGCTWTDAIPVDVPSNNSGVDAVLLADGRVALAYNHSTTMRTPLVIATSADLGVTWQAGPVLEDARGEYSYPAIVQAPDGTVHLTYTWRRERIAYVRLAADGLR